MISFSKIGNYGRLGNQLFQYSMLFGLQNYLKKNNTNIDILTTNINAEIYKYFKISNKIQYNSKPFVRYLEKKFTFNQEILNFDYKNLNIDFEGYYQTDKYWLHCEKELITHLNFKNCIQEKFTNKSYSNTCSIHIRRGDYLNLPEYHTNLDLKYYNEAIKIIENKNINDFLIFSDDIDWCKNNFIGKKFKFSEKNNSGEDLFLMSKCQYHIIANSSFSWWGSALSKNKITVAPKNWFGPKITHNTSDLYRKNWIII